MRKILLPVDGSISSQFAAAHVVERLNGGEAFAVHLVNVQYRPRAHAGLGRVVSQSMIDEYIEDQGKAAFAPVAAILAEAGIHFGSQVLNGDPGRAVADLVATSGFSEVVMGTRGTSALAGILVGSIATKVVNLVDVPVTLVPVPHLALHRTGHSTPENASIPRSTDARWQTLLPVDGSDHALRAVDHVIAEAGRGVRNDLTLLNVQTPYPTSGIWDALTPEVIAQVYRDEAQQHLRAPQARLDAARLPYRTLIESGAPAETIARVAKEQRCERLVMGTRGMGAAGNLLFGSTAKRVLHLVEVPVTLVK